MECPICRVAMIGHEYLGTVQGDEWTQEQDRAPHPGDVSLCDGCGSVLIFDEDRVRCPTFREALDIACSPAGPALAAAQREILQRRAMRERAN